MSIQNGSPPADGLPITGYLRLPQVLEIFPVSRATWWNGVKSGLYPKPIKLSANTSAWSVSDIRALIERLNAQQTDKAA